MAKNKGRMARNKGARGERELASKLTELMRRDHIRAAQRNGKFGADVILHDPQDCYGVHWECKRVEALNIHDAVNQAVMDAVGENVPAVAHRKNETEWLVTIRMQDLLGFAQRIYLGAMQ
jgi:Holliday junction resolvase